MTDRRERLLDILASRAIEGIDEAEAHELELLLEEFPDVDVNSFDLTAAAIDSALAPPPLDMPAALRARITADGIAYAASLSRTSPATSTGPDPSTRTGSSGVRLVPTAHLGGRRVEAQLGWLLASAAAVAAVAGWWPRLSQRAADSSQVVTEPTPDPTPAAARATLLASGSALFEKEWTVTDDPAASRASGDVVWSDIRNEGYMRIAGLEPNDPERFQYQLWVFDRTRDERYPVDGGVFDMAASGEVVVPIDPKIPVHEAVLFAITVEKPGGVVVSDRERIVLLAQAG